MYIANTFTNYYLFSGVGISPSKKLFTHYKNKIKALKLYLIQYYMSSILNFLIYS
jgi:hypothetical protein